MIVWTDEHCCWEQMHSVATFSITANKKRFHSCIRWPAFLLHRRISLWSFYLCNLVSRLFHFPELFVKDVPFLPVDVFLYLWIEGKILYTYVYLCVYSENSELKPSVFEPTAFPEGCSFCPYVITCHRILTLLAQEWRNDNRAQSSTRKEFVWHIIIFDVSSYFQTKSRKEVSFADVVQLHLTQLSIVTVRVSVEDNSLANTTVLHVSV
jgi:hypothetical protein